jgi:hypothetical protein
MKNKIRVIIFLKNIKTNFVLHFLDMNYCQMQFSYNWCVVQYYVMLSHARYF